MRITERIIDNAKIFIKDFIRISSEYRLTIGRKPSLPYPSLTIDIVQSISFTLGISLDKYNTLIESGTFRGQTIINLQPHIQTLHTIELSEQYYKYFNEVKKQNNYTNVVNHFGDSCVVIPEILKTLTENNKVIFWLDGHWSSGDTAQGEKDCPLIEECTSIDNLYVADTALILIDDHRLFSTHINEDWSDITTENICKCFNNYKIKKRLIYKDILVLLIEK